MLQSLGVAKSRTGRRELNNNNSSTESIHETEVSVRKRTEWGIPYRNVEGSFCLLDGPASLTISHAGARVDERVQCTGPPGRHDGGESRHQASKNQHLLFCTVRLKCLKPQKKQPDSFTSYLKTKPKAAKWNMQSYLYKGTTVQHWFWGTDLEAQSITEVLHQVLPCMTRKQGHCSPAWGPEGLGSSAASAAF